MTTKTNQVQLADATQGQAVTPRKLQKPRKESEMKREELVTYSCEGGCDQGFDLGAL